MAEPQFTILICVKDRIELLRQCLESLRKVASEATAQLLIVCDGGPEKMRESLGPMIEAPGWECEWIDVPAGGPARARNAALPRCRGELILFLNDDVRFDAGLLTAHLRLHEKRPGHAVMGNTRWAPEVAKTEFMHWVAHHDSFYYLIPDELSATWEYFHTMNLSVHRKWFDEGARFDESFPDPAFEDTELGYRLCQQGMKIGLAYDAVLYHVHEFTPEQYIQKSIMRGRSARRFCNLYPELTNRILDDYRAAAAKLDGIKGKLRQFKMDELEIWESKIARAFLQGAGE